MKLSKQAQKRLEKFENKLAHFKANGNKKRVADYQHRLNDIYRFMNTSRADWEKQKLLKKQQAQYNKLISQLPPNVIQQLKPSYRMA